MTATAWYVVYTQPSAEAKAEENLRRQGFITYLPRYRKRRRHARRTDMVLRPLFPRYLFVAVDLLQDRWRSILSTFGVSDLVCHGTKPTPVPDSVVATLRATETDGLIEEGHLTETLKVGDRVQIVSGAFADLIGNFQGMADAERVFVLLDLLGRQVRTEIHADTVAPA